MKGNEIARFLETAKDWTEHSIRRNRRSDGLYHAYNLITQRAHEGISIRRLYEMLEGQVAALSSGSLRAGESLELLTALKHSAMFRPDQHSYLLYPDRKLPRFLEKNNISPKEIARSGLLRQLIADGNGLLVERDAAGGCHFNGSLANEREVRNVLAQLADAGYAKLVGLEAALVLEIYERTFDHQSFTGRSGTFFGYEGLGCIYWHMVSKLLLAAQETFFQAADAGAPNPVLKQLAACYHDVRAGIGDCKSPEVYGAFPLDPYSHTPGHAGARQPGLTGQVKEDILCRMGELGIFVEAGRICFRPLLLRRAEFLKVETEFCFFGLAGRNKKIKLQPDSLAFTYCQTLIVYRLARNSSLCVTLADGSACQQAELRLDADLSRSIFDRTGRVKRIDAAIVVP